MRFNIPTTGQERKVTKFLWFPTKIQDTIYWLETVTIRQSYNTTHMGWSNDRVV